MPTRRKTLAGGAGALALITGVVFLNQDEGAEGGSDDETEQIGSEAEPESTPEPEPTSESEPTPDPNEPDARFETAIDFPDEDQRIHDNVEFAVTIENTGDVAVGYTVVVELDRIDPDTDFGSGLWELSGTLESGRAETYVVEHNYRATGSYEIRLEDVVVEEFDVLGGGRTRSAQAGGSEADLDEISTVDVGGHATVNATEESPSQYDSD